MAVSEGRAAEDHYTKLALSLSDDSIRSNSLAKEGEEDDTQKQEEKENTSKQTEEDNSPQKEGEDDTHRPTVCAWAIGKQ